MSAKEVPIGAVIFNYREILNYRDVKRQRVDSVCWTFQRVSVRVEATSEPYRVLAYEPLVGRL